MPGERLLNLTDPHPDLSVPHCCHQMLEQVQFRCPQHDDPFDCADHLIFYSPVFDEYGIILHDGSSTYVAITHCPWCGVRLPVPKRDRWFDELEALGFDDPLDQKIPAEYTTDAWYRRKA